MTIQILQASRTTYGSYFRAQCGNRTAQIAIYHYGIQVVNQNAMHRAWRGQGRLHRTAADALAHYKTGEMRAMIQAAVDFNAAEVSK